MRGQEIRQAGWWTALGQAFGLFFDESVALCDPSRERGRMLNVEGAGLMRSPRNLAAMGRSVLSGQRPLVALWPNLAVHAVVTLSE